MYRKIMITLLITVLMTTNVLSVFAAEENVAPANASFAVDSEGEPLTTIINGEIYYLVPAPPPDEQIVTRAPMYDWKVGPVTKTSKHIKSLTLEAARTAVATVLSLPNTSAAVMQLAKGIVNAFKIGMSVNVYYTEYNYYAENVTGYGGYPYYCKFITYQYKDSARTIDITGGDPPIKYYYAYQPY